MSIKQRTPIIKPRVQGGTFYTFGSALEDIGLNINDTNNKVSLSHYMLIDIPSFGSAASDPDLVIPHRGSYSQNTGDYIFSEYFQDAILNMETVLRNQPEYNFASPHTVSERTFWKWVLKDVPDSSFSSDTSGGKEYFYMTDPSKSIAKCFGRIVSGSHRSDSEGIYNETFVQIPSSYGQMKVLFKSVTDENYTKDGEYASSNGTKIEGITDDEITGNTIDATGIDARGIFDSGTSYTNENMKLTNFFEAELDIRNLSEYYGQSDLDYDDLGFGTVDDDYFGSNFNFNAILVYYSIYDSTGVNILSTNAFGVYILGNAMEQSSGGKYMFPELNKSKTTSANSGTSFSFRLNIKATSAYLGDITVTDNSSTAFAEAVDFNDVIKNLSTITEILKTNARALNSIVSANNELKTFAKDAIEKVDDISKTVSAITDSSIYDSIATETVLMETHGTLPFNMESISDSILKNTKTTFDSNGNVSITINTGALSGDAKSFADGMVRVIGNKKYCDISKLLCLLLSKSNMYSRSTAYKN